MCVLIHSQTNMFTYSWTKYGYILSKNIWLHTPETSGWKIEGKTTGALSDIIHICYGRQDQASVANVFNQLPF